MGVTLTNNAHTTLAANISSTDTTIYVDDVSDFPTLGVGDYFYCTLESTTGTIEIVKVTQINSGSFIAVRGQENTIAVPFNIGARVELRLTVQNLEDQFAKLLSASYTAADVLSKLLTVDGTGSGLDADLLDGSHASAFATLAGANVFTHATGNTLNGRLNVDPTYAVYDTFLGVEASMFSFGSASLTVAASKHLDFFRADNTFNIGSAGIASYTTLNLESESGSHSTSNLYAGLVSITNKGPGTVKTWYSRVSANNSSTGPIVGAVSAVTPGSSTSLSTAHQFSIDSTNKKIDYGLWLTHTNTTDQVDYAFLIDEHVTVNQSGFTMFAAGAGAFARLFNSTGSSTLFEVASTGKITTLSTLELGHASDTTIARDSAGNISVEGNVIYRAGGTDIPVTDGGTGSSTAAGARTNLGFANGTYTPTLTGVANVAASTAYSCFYTQIGDVVHVAGKVDLDPTAGAATWTRLRMTLPVASNFSDSSHAAGTTVSYAGAPNNYGAILADATNDAVEISIYPIDIGNQSWYFTFMYRVL